MDDILKEVVKHFQTNPFGKALVRIVVGLLGIIAIIFLIMGLNWFLTHVVFTQVGVTIIVVLILGSIAYAFGNSILKTFGD